MTKKLERYEIWHERQMRDSAYRRSFDEFRRRGLLAYRIVQIRRQLGLTQREFAKRMGIRQPALARIECGEPETVKISTLERVAKAAGRRLEIRFGNVSGSCTRCGGPLEHTRAIWRARTGPTEVAVSAVPIGKCAECGKEHAPEPIERVFAELNEMLVRLRRRGTRQIRLGDVAVFDECSLQEALA